MKTTATTASRIVQTAAMTCVGIASMKTKGVPSAMTKNRKKMKKSPKAENTPTMAAPILRFSPTAWAKLLYLRDRDETEVGGFAITAADDLLHVEDVQLVRQTTSWAHVAFHDESVADFFDQQVDMGRQPEQFARLWVHTHPGNCPQPSMTDEETFARAFGRSDWAIMFILARNGNSYARLRFNVGPHVDVEIPIEIDYSRPFPGCDTEAWENEYLTNVQPEHFGMENDRSQLAAPLPNDELSDDWEEAWGEYTNAEQSIEGFIL
jgi:proteasome lid subunit RPN8/RPN11